jgi:hypothetical protein
MKARAMNSKAMVAAAMMMAMTVMAARSASASPLAGLGDQPVSTRTVMKYYQGAWTSPCAVVLHSAGEWAAWNQEMVARGMAVGAEAVPANVDWSREAVLVVSLGLNPDARMSLDVAGADHRAGRTDLQLSVSYDRGGSAPCVVVAMDKNLAGAVTLPDGASMGLPQTAQQYAAAPVLAANAASTGVAATWGEMKDAYRR